MVAQRTHYALDRLVGPRGYCERHTPADVAVLGFGADHDVVARFALVAYRTNPDLELRAELNSNRQHLDLADTRTRLRRACRNDRCRCCQASTSACNELSELATIREHEVLKWTALGPIAVIR